jgi:outer membrane protein TolC
MRSTPHVSEQPIRGPQRSPRLGLVESKGRELPPVKRWQDLGGVPPEVSGGPSSVGPSRWLPLIVACGLLVVPVAATAQESSGQPRLSLGTAVGRALVHYPTITAAAAGEAEARAVLGVAQAARRPDVQVRGSVTQYQKPTLVSPIHAFQAGLTPPFDETLLQTVVGGTYTLFDGGARRAQIDQARSQVEASAAASRSIEDVVIAQVVANYSRVLGRSRTLDAHDRRIAALDRERNRVEQMRAAGRAADLEQLRVAAALETARAERVQIAEALDTAERELARLVGAHPDETRAARLDPLAIIDRQEPDREALVAGALGASPVLENARHRVAAAEAAIGAAESGRWPQLQAVGNFVGFGSAAGHFTSEWNAGMQVVFPLFNGGATGQRIARARAARDAAAEQVRNVELQIRGEIDRALSALREAGARLAGLESAILQFTEVVRIEKLRLETGTGTQTDYLAAEADLLGARASLADVQYGEVVARVELARATGLLDPATLPQLLTVKP